MKTSVTMTRRMGQFEVLQRTKDGFFDANALLRQWNANGGNADLRISKFLNQQKVIEFIEALKEELKDGANQPIGDYQLLINVKGRRDKRGVKTPDQVWMHPYLFVKFAMWLNPRFEVKVVKFVYDQLIQYRHSAGDNYNVLAKSIAALPDVDYPQVARALNWIVFNKHERDIRNTATPQQLQDMDELQRKLAFSVDMGYIRSFPDLMNSMRRIYNRQHAKF
jgi:hypothetical protein